MLGVFQNRNSAAVICKQWLSFVLNFILCACGLLQQSEGTGISDFPCPESVLLLQARTWSSFTALGPQISHNKTHLSTQNIGRDGQDTEMLLVSSPQSRYFHSVPEERTAGRACSVSVLTRSGVVCKNYLPLEFVISLPFILCVLPSLPWPRPQH